MRHAPRLPLHVVTTAVLVVGWLTFAPGRAAAECGDHVTVAGQPAHADREPSPELPRPCHGPNCSTRPAVPLPPVTVPLTEQTSPNDPATAPTETAGGSHRGEWIAFETTPRPSSRLPAPIYHPPR